MRETRLSGSEGGATLIWSSLPLSITWSLRDKKRPISSVVGSDFSQNQIDDEGKPEADEPSIIV